MAKKKVVYFCSACGSEAPQWLGKCPQCGGWNTFTQMTIADSPRTRKAGHRDIRQHQEAVQPVMTVPLAQHTRCSVGSGEFDRVVGGGIVPESTILIAGEPGIGKSTLMLQVCSAVSASTGNVLYVAAEESLQQVRARTERLGLAAPNLYVVAAGDMEQVMAHLDSVHPVMVVVDSIQAVSDGALAAPPGTLTQVRECALALCHRAKEQPFILFLIGHVTKDGMLAGPKSLEHLVDTVLYFEGDRYQQLRMVRAVKNRFGATGEIGIFEMTERGLRDEPNPSSIFLSDEETLTPGRAIVAMIEGRRPFLVEVQALTNKTSFPSPLRRSLGVEVNKISLLLAVIERTLGLTLNQHDVFVKAVGGLSVDDPAGDVALAVAIVSSFLAMPVPRQIAYIGEVGLGGEVRKVHFLDARIAEAARLGFETIIIPRGTVKERKTYTAQVVEVAHLRDVYQMVFGKKN